MGSNAFKYDSEDVEGKIMTPKPCALNPDTKVEGLGFRGYSKAYTLNPKIQGLGLWTKSFRDPHKGCNFVRGMATWRHLEGQGT